MKISKVALYSTLMIAPVAAAHDYSEIVVFGDSLSDTGNLYTLDISGVEGIVGQTYGPRFSNGPLLAEYVAEGLALGPLIPTIPSGFTGNNYAVAGAVSLAFDEVSAGNALSSQVDTHLQVRALNISDSTLYLITIGGNDVRAARSFLSDQILNPSVKRPRVKAYRQVKAAANETLAQIERLAELGAGNIVIVNTPDIGSIPENEYIRQSMLLQAENFREKLQSGFFNYSASNLSASYNYELAKGVRSLRYEYPELELTLFDFAEVTRDAMRRPERFGFTNVKNECQFLLTPLGALEPDESIDCTGFLFYDQIHPTTEGHQVAANALLEQLDKDK